MEEIIIGLGLMANVLFSPVNSSSANLALNETVLASHTMSLETRHPVPSVNEVFSDNILFALHYFKGDEASMRLDEAKPMASSVDWEKVREPFEFEIELKSGETFAFHKNLLPEFKKDLVKAGRSSFSYDDGYKAIAGLYGNGVCHLASLIKWVVSDAQFEGKKLGLVSRVNHDFAPVPEIDRKYGVSIYYAPDGSRGSASQNLYVTNIHSFPIKLVFKADKSKVEFKIVK
ncbi:MAG: hypothetical protein C4584_00205 [Armatimonadetes bacterium]|nr:MAG: hypothetical protein C4584_00205 [Armatimonadota bacterium]